MIIDYRKGSVDLIPALRSKGVTVKKGKLEFGDAKCWVSGKVVRSRRTLPTIESETGLTVGVEIKTVLDVLACINDGRFAGHQLPGLVKSYDFVWLLVEGEWRGDRSGVLEIKGSTFSSSGRRKGTCWTEPYGRRILESELLAWLFTMVFKGGIHVQRVPDRRETVAFLTALSRWCEKGWDSHKSHLVFHDEHMRKSRDDRQGAISALFPRRRPRDVCDPLLLSPVGFARRVAAEFPNFGYDRSGGFVKRFATPRDMLLWMASASKEEWEEIDGIGEGIATKIQRVLDGACV